MKTLKRALIGAGLAILAVPGVESWAHSWQWAYAAGTGIVAGLVAALIVSERTAP